MQIPEDVLSILNTLQASGFEAYAVGGCVRDTILGRSPNDWDICTSALPEETADCFSGCQVLETGKKHGTVTVIRQGIPYEITTFRQDGDYRDHRRPKQVRFVSSLGEDLARRDFTIGAMAVNREGRIVDLFGGREDLENKCIRCVGDPNQRFQEDALRILRGLRFAAQLEFSIHPDTAQAMEEEKALLRFVSGERIFSEMNKLLMGPGVVQVLKKHGSVLRAVLPEIGPTMGFLQYHPCHDKDVWGHTLEALSHAGNDIYVRWALLFHDLGKPQCFFRDEQGVGHFYGHAQRSEALAQGIFTRLRADRATRDRVSLLVREHHYAVPVTEQQARRCILKFGPEGTKLLLEVKRCDALAHRNTPEARDRYEAVLEMTRLVEKALSENVCCKVTDLQIGGRDLMAMGVSRGPEIGGILKALLLDVVEGRCENTREALMNYVKRYFEDTVTARKEEP